MLPMPAPSSYDHPADDPASREKWRRAWDWLTSNPEAKKTPLVQIHPAAEENGNGAAGPSH
jgi:hypothetical protein